MKSVQTYFIILVGFLILNSCANVVQLSGGKKDGTAPVILKSSPANSSVNFSDKQIEITFDEFIQLKNINQEFFVSPPIAKMPDIKAKGKSLVVNFAEKLAENTTYTLGFGNAIADITEGNSIKGFSFRFSTGNTIDTLSIVGNVKNAQTFLAPEKAFVFLHSNLNDSAPQKLLPNYVANCNKTGDYNIQNIRPGKYKIYALSDINNNLKFDLPNEMFAFKDSILDIKYPAKVDTTKNYLAKIDLQIFEQESKNVFVKDKKRDSRQMCVAIFNKAQKDKPTFSYLDKNLKSDFVIDYNPTLDTVKIWLKDTNQVKKDTIKLISQYKTFDKNSWIDKKDTLSFVKITNKKSKPELKFTPTSNVLNSTSVSEKSNFYFTFNQPLNTIDTSKVEFTQIVNKKSKRVKYSIVKDSNSSSKCFVQFKPEINKDYLFKTKIGAFKSIYNEQSDTLRIAFKVVETSNLGSLFLTLNNVNQNIVVQLISESNKVIRENSVSKSGKIEFLNVQQGKYTLKAIFDNNKDGKWTTGDYSKKQQPEKTIKYKDAITIKPNWDFEINWDL